MADTKTYLKVPYRKTTLRSLPFNGGHLTALTMAKQLKDDARKLNVVLRVLNKLLGDEAYEQITNDFIDGEVETKDLMNLLQGIVDATAAYHKAKAEEPDPEPEPGGE